MIFDKTRLFVTGAVFWCLGLHACFQIFVGVVIGRLKDDEIFWLGGTYGNSFSLLLVSWVLDVLLFVIVTTTILVRRSVEREVMNGRD